MNIFESPQRPYMQKRALLPSSINAPTNGSAQLVDPEQRSIESSSKQRFVELLLFSEESDSILVSYVFKPCFYQLPCLIRKSSNSLKNINHSNSKRLLIPKRHRSLLREKWNTPSLTFHRLALSAIPTRNCQFLHPDIHVFVRRRQQVWLAEHEI